MTIPCTESISGFDFGTPPLHAWWAKHRRHEEAGSDNELIAWQQVMLDDADYLARSVNIHHCSKNVSKSVSGDFHVSCRWSQQLISLAKFAYGANMST